MNRHICLALCALTLLLSTIQPAMAADLERGRQLYNSAPRSGLLACVDCHGERPQEQNFGNIWAGRHATFLIERAISINTGGMGYFRNFYGKAELADIAAWLGTTPNAITFPDTAIGTVSTGRSVVLSSSSKSSITGLTWGTEGDYTVGSSNCGPSVERFSSCTLEVTFSPREPGLRSGALLIAHDGSTSPIRIPLGGAGQARPAAVASIGPEILRFDRTSPAHAATLRNNSRAPLTIHEIKVNGPSFRWVGGSCVPGQLLPAQASCSLLVAFVPDQTGQQRGIVSITHDGQGGMSNVDLEGDVEALKPRLAIANSAVDLGAVLVGEVATTDWLSMINKGPGALTWTLPTFGDPTFSLAASDCEPGKAMAPGASCRVKIAFQPARPGRFTSTLRWPVSSTITPELPVWGNGTPPIHPSRVSESKTQSNLASNAKRPSWAVDRIVLPLGAGATGGRVTRLVTLKNLNDQALDITRIAIVGQAAASFNLSGSCRTGIAVPPQGTCQIEVSHLQTRTEDSLQASLLVRAGQAEDEAIVLLDASKVEVFAGQPDWRAADTLPTNAGLELRTDRFPQEASTYWGEVLVGETTTPRVVTVVNSSGMPSQPLAWHVAGEGVRDWSFGIPEGANACEKGQVLAAGAECSLNIRFHPTGPGQRQVWLFVAGANAKPALRLSGTGLVSASGRLSVYPPVITFQSTPGSAPPSQIVVFANEGAATARVAGLGLTSAAFATAASAGACPAPPFDLLPGLHCTLSLTWSGSAAGAAGAELVVVMDGTTDQLKVPIAVTEDPALRANVGSGGAGHWQWWLALLVATVWLRSSRANPDARIQFSRG